MSSDVLYLAGRIRAARISGRMANLKVDPGLLARKDEFDRLVADAPRRMEQFFAEVRQDLAGSPIFLLAGANLLHNMAEAVHGAGLRELFAADSVIMSGGGGKDVTLPVDWKSRALDALGAKSLKMAYGMSELSLDAMACSLGHYHVNPWTVPFVLDPDTSKPLPRTGVQTGRAAFFDLLAETRWGGFISGDEVTLHWDHECPCGRTTPYYDTSIERYSDKRGGDDKITCAATEEAHRDAMEFLSQVED
jgi:hypothetical protein